MNKDYRASWEAVHSICSDNGMSSSEAIISVRSIAWAILTEIDKERKSEANQKAI